MNRFSLIFAALIATSFVVHPTPAGQTPTAEAGQKRAPAIAQNKAKATPPEVFLQDFLHKARLPKGQSPQPQILFATVPHPIETHLASAFDKNVEAMTDGLQEAGFIFDSSWIPWTTHEPRDRFDDDEKEEAAKADEDRTPGILLFRRKELQGNVYSQGMVVFLIAEKPTEGISLAQVEAARGLLKTTGIPFAGDIRILGPTYSGSFASLEPMVSYLSGENHAANVIIRSGSVTGGYTAEESMKRLGGEMKTRIDFGSAMHDYFDFFTTALTTLYHIGIESSRTAILSENESYYGGFTIASQAWKITFPRDISSLRANYERQGILDTGAAPLWRRFLNLQSEDESQGDSVRSFGEAATVAAQESILFGISEFLKAHGIRAVIISATNEEDRYFLAQFLHVHNAGVRIVVIGSTRVFMRGNTAQFRGDMVVDNFPMLPRLLDWTGGWQEVSEAKLRDTMATLFADAESEGVYFAAIDLFTEPRCPNGAGTCAQSELRFRGYPEYSEPNWNPTSPHELRPPMYVAALGSNATWPVSESKGNGWSAGTGHPWYVAMPFKLFRRDPAISVDTPPPAARISVGLFWKILFVLVIISTAAYGACFWCADPVTRTLFAGFEPSADWRFWLFKVTLPALVVLLAFQVLAWSIAIPNPESLNSVLYWEFAQVLAAVAPLGIALSAMGKALLKSEVSATSGGMAFALVSVIGMDVVSGLVPSFRPTAFASHDLGSILNTYREMHWESGLSLVPTWFLLFLAVLIWAAQASHGAALFDAFPRLPACPGDARISEIRGQRIARVGRPLPLPKETKWLWIVWAVITLTIFAGHFLYRPFVEITTLESKPVTRLVFVVSATVTSLMILDLVQFLWLWDSLRGLLIALNRQPFRRSFVPIQDFKWNNLWSFSGLSFRDRRAVNAAQADCVLELAHKHRPHDYLAWATTLERMRERYNKVPLDVEGVSGYRKDLQEFMGVVAAAGTKSATDVANMRFEATEGGIGAKVEAIQRALACNCGERFSDENEEVARLPEWQQTAERLLCLLYIGFIQAVVARLHNLFISVALIFSLIVLAFAIYPFVPLSPLLITGGVLLIVIGWAFFKVFSEMDTDPILARIVNGDDRKLQGNFYLKYAESLALPILTLASSLLPGGAGRLLELVQSLINRGQ